MTIDTGKFEVQMKKWILEFVILSIISRWDSYSSDILNILQENNLIVVEWTLYPLLSRLKNDWYISYYWKESQFWPPRKYFKITDLWKKLLLELNSAWESISKSINDIISLK